MIGQVRRKGERKEVWKDGRGREEVRGRERGNEQERVVAEECHKGRLEPTNLNDTLQVRTY